MLQRLAVAALAFALTGFSGQRVEASPIGFLFHGTLGPPSAAPFTDLPFREGDRFSVQVTVQQTTLVDYGNGVAEFIGNYLITLIHDDIWYQFARLGSVDEFEAGFQPSFVTDTYAVSTLNGFGPFPQILTPGLGNSFPSSIFIRGPLSQPLLSLPVPPDKFQHEFVVPDAVSLGNIGFSNIVERTPNVVYGLRFDSGPTPIPEPASLMLLGTGMAWLSRRRVKRVRPARPTDRCSRHPSA